MQQRRKNYFINKKFQSSFFVKFLALLLLETILIIGLFLYLSNDTITTGYADSILKVDTTRDFFFVPFVMLTFIVFGGIGLAGMIVFVLISHKIAGPLYRFETVIKQMGQGDLTSNFSLRDADQLIEFQDSLNQLISSLDGRMGRIKNNLKEIKGLLSQANDPEVGNQISQKIKALEEELDHFKVSSEQS